MSLQRNKECTNYFLWWVGMKNYRYKKRESHKGEWSFVGFIILSSSPLPSINNDLFLNPEPYCYRLLSQQDRLQSIKPAWFSNSYTNGTPSPVMKTVSRSMLTGSFAIPEPCTVIFTAWHHGWLNRGVNHESDVVIMTCQEKLTGK